METYNNLSHKHKMFVDYFIKEGNASKAYVKAGYSPNGANTSACQLLAKPYIKEAIEQRKGVLLEELNITEEDLKRVWRDILYDPDAKNSDKIALTTLIAKYLGLLQEKQTNNALILTFKREDLESIRHDEQIIDV